MTSRQTYTTGDRFFVISPDPRLRAGRITQSIVSAQFQDEHTGQPPAVELAARTAFPRLTPRSTVDGLAGAVAWELRDLNRFQHVSFRGEPHLTTYDKLWYYWGVEEHLDPWEQLAEHYPPALVDAARVAIQ